MSGTPASLVMGPGWPGVVGVSGGRPLPYEQIVAAGGRYASDFLSSPGAAQLQLQNRRPALTGGKPVWYFRLCYTGYGGPVETLVTTQYNIECAIEIPSAPNPGPFRAKWSGADNFDVTAGANAVSDKVFASQFGYSNGIPPGTLIYIRDSLICGGTGATYLYPIVKGTNAGGNVVAETGTQFFYSPVTASQVMNTGNMTTPAGGADAFALTPLAAIVGAFTRPEVSLLIIGDSQAMWLNDQRSVGVNATTGGAYARAAIGVNGRNIPWANLSVGGSRANQYVPSSARRAFFYKYATHAFCNYGINDVRASVAAATTLANLRLIWAALKTGGISHVEQQLCTPNTTGAWTLADGSDQTVAAAFQDGGIRDTQNASIVSDVGSNGLDYALDLASSIEMAADHTKWRAGAGASAYTADGLHWSTLALSGGSPTVTSLIAARYALMQPARTSWVS